MFYIKRAFVIGVSSHGDELASFHPDVPERTNFRKEIQSFQISAIILLLFSVTRPPPSRFSCCRPSPRANTEQPMASSIGESCPEICHLLLVHMLQISCGNDLLLPRCCCSPCSFHQCQLLSSVRSSCGLAVDNQIWVRL